jgi:hypothetical protein
MAYLANGDTEISGEPSGILDGRVATAVQPPMPALTEHQPAAFGRPADQNGVRGEWNDAGAHGHPFPPLRTRARMVSKPSLTLSLMSEAAS